jgi:hypothetical protein
MADAKPPQKRDFKTAVEDTKAIATGLAMKAESVLGRRTAHVLGIVALFAVAVALLLVFLNWFISPDTAQERQGLALVLAISLGGIAAIVGLYFTRQTLIETRKVEARRAREAASRAREAALRACLEQLGRLLTHEKWSTKDRSTKEQEGDTDDTDDTDDTLRHLARAEVLSVLGTLDSPRKRILVRFLYESQLLNKYTPEVDLNGADLSRLNLTNASLSNVRLGGADLHRANLKGGDLSYSDLGVISNGAPIRTDRTDLSRANLSGANLSGANLREAQYLTQRQIQWTRGSHETTLPKGLNYPALWTKSIEEQVRIVQEHLQEHLEEQRQRVMEVVRREKGVDCPELVVLGAEAVLGGGLVHYRCKEGDPSESLKLTREASEYVGIDMSVHDRPESGG